MTMSIRPESPADIPAIHALTKAAFLPMPYATHTEQFIVDALRAADALTVSLVAEDGGCVIGHVAVSPITLSSGALDWHALGPISVSPERQKQGIGSKLMRAALKQLKDKGAAGCVLAGDPNYYGRFGFVHQRNLAYPALPAEFFLALSFSKYVPHGTVQFHAAFEAKG